MPSEAKLTPEKRALTSLEEIRQALVDTRKSDTFRRLRLYYSHRSIFDIVGVSRKEDAHTRILAWLLDPSGSHGLGTKPLRRLFEAVVVSVSKGKQSASVDTLPVDVLDHIVAGSYRISTAQVTVEKPVNGLKSGRIDIFVEGLMAYPSTYRVKEGSQKTGSGEKSTQTFRVLIENKVTSTEHSQQTDNYYKWLTDTRAEETVDIPLFLTPISMLELDELEEPQCACKKFIQINYQYLVDYVIVPCLQQDIGAQASWVLKEYARTLSTSTNTENSAMALGKEERNLLHDFLDENNALFKAIMLAISQDESRDKEERDAAEDYLKVSSKDRSDVQILVGGEAERTFPYKSDVGHEVVRVLLEHDLLDDGTFEELRRDNTTGRFLLKQISDMQGDEAEKRYRTRDDQKIEYGGKTYYASSQWTSDSVSEFDDVIQNLLPEEAPSVKIKLVDSQ